MMNVNFSNEHFIFIKSIIQFKKKSLIIYFKMFFFIFLIFFKGYQDLSIILKSENFNINTMNKVYAIIKTQNNSDQFIQLNFQILQVK